MRGQCERCRALQQALAALKTRRVFRGRRPSGRSVNLLCRHWPSGEICFVLPETEAPQPDPDIHPRFLRPASSMMVSRGRSVHSVGQK